MTIGAALMLALDGRAVALAGIHQYQRHLAPLVGRVGMECRFTPSCSHYAETAIARDGLIVGGARALRRIARCGPWTPRGTVDEP